VVSGPGPGPFFSSYCSVHWAVGTRTSISAFLNPLYSSVVIRPPNILCVRIWTQRRDIYIYISKGAKKCRVICIYDSTWELHWQIGSAWRGQRRMPPVVISLHSTRPVLSVKMRHHGVRLGTPFLTLACYSSVYIYIYIYIYI
jgi:hypothetical protein